MAKAKRSTFRKGAKPSKSNASASKVRSTRGGGRK